MENKKLLKFLLLNLSELEELVTEKESDSFDEFEMEFLQSRLKESKKLAKRLMENEQNGLSEISVDEKLPQNKNITEKSVKETAAKKETKVSPPPIQENKTEMSQPEEKPKAEESVSKKVEEVKENAEVEEEKEEVKAAIKSDTETPVASEEKKEEKEELQEEEEELKDKRLGESFIKGKSVNDLMNAEPKNLENKLSNRPVLSIQAAVGINDKFQYIRELFDGNADKYKTTLIELDKMNDISEAVKYLQQHFSWKKNETSLKFVNLVKRRFSNE